MKSVNLVASVAYHGEYLAGDFIGIDYGASYLYHSGIEMVALIGDFDSLPEEDYQLISHLDIDILRLNPVKDETDLEAAINYALINNYEIINVYGALGERVDHTLTNLNLLKKYPILTLYDDYSKIYILEKGIHNFNIKNYKYCSFFAIKEGLITLKGFKYPLNNYNLTHDDTLCISNEIKENAVVETSEDIIVVLSK